MLDMIRYFRARRASFWCENQESSWTLRASAVSLNVSHCQGRNVAETRHVLFMEQNRSSRRSRDNIYQNLSGQIHQKCDRGKHPVTHVIFMVTGSITAVFHLDHLSTAKQRHVDHKPFLFSWCCDSN